MRVQFLTRKTDAYGEQKIAYQQTDTDKSGLGVMFCGGFRSDMTGTKAQALAEWARARATPRAARTHIACRLRPCRLGARSGASKLRPLLIF